MVLVALSSGLAWAVHVGVRDQERRLLKGRTNEVGLVFTSAVSTTSSTLGTLGKVLAATQGSTAEFDRVAAAEVGAGTNQLTYALMRPTPSGFEVVAVAGRGLSAGQVISDARADTLRRAMTVKTMVTTPVVGPARVLGFAMGPPTAPAGMVLYRQSTLGPVSAPSQAGTAPFHELDVVLYASAHVDPAQVLVTTSRTLPLRGSVRYQPVQVGSTPWLLAVAARTSLVGSTAEAAPWAALAVGIVLALLVAAVLEVEGRRRRAAMELYSSEHRVAETLQRSLLPELPSLPGLDLAARYVAGGADQEVGGDWFDVFPIEGGRVGLAIGDVMGHDLVAATNMSQIRAALRAYAWQGDTPAGVLDQLDRFVTTFALTPLVTVFYGVLDAPEADGTRILRYANAGHLPPLLQTPEGAVQDLAGGGSVIVGGLLAHRREQAEQRLTVGSTIVLFTDGLVETPSEGLDDSLAALAERIASQEPSLSVDQLSEWVLRGATGDQKDDVALLIARILAPEPPAPPPSGMARADDAEPGRPLPIPGPDGHPSTTNTERPDIETTADDVGAHTDRAALPIS